MKHDHTNLDSIDGLGVGNQQQFVQDGAVAGCFIGGVVFMLMVASAIGGAVYFFKMVIDIFF